MKEFIKNVIIQYIFTQTIVTKVEIHYNADSLRLKLVVCCVFFQCIIILSESVIMNRQVL